MKRKIIFQLLILPLIPGLYSRKYNNKDPGTCPLPAVGAFGTTEGMPITTKQVEAAPTNQSLFKISATISFN